MVLLCYFNILRSQCESVLRMYIVVFFKNNIGIEGKKKYNFIDGCRAVKRAAQARPGPARYIFFRPSPAQPCPARENFCCPARHGPLYFFLPDLARKIFLPNRPDIV